MSGLGTTTAADLGPRLKSSYFVLRLFSYGLVNAKRVRVLVCSGGCRGKCGRGRRCGRSRVGLSHGRSGPQVRWNEPGAHYSLVEKEKLPRFPFLIDQEGDIYVTQPLDREEKDAVSRPGGRSAGHGPRAGLGELTAGKILLKNSNKKPHTVF